jgi:L-ascorbate metabolism protein UlaG (beta-lactamase superfamily)
MTWLGQSGFKLRFSTARVLIDAFLSPHPDRLVAPAFEPGAATGFDVIACTHDHLDHLDLDALPAMAVASPGALVVVPAPSVDAVLRVGIPADRVVGMQPGRPVEASGLTIHAVPACHGVHPSDAYNFGGALSGGRIRYLGYVVVGDGVAVYHAGDTIDYDGLADGIRLLHADVALLPINGRDPERESKDIVGNLDAVEAARLAATSGVKVAVPMHYDMFAANLGRPELFVQAVRGQRAAVTAVVLARGVEFVYTKAGA